MPATLVASQPVNASVVLSVPEPVQPAPARVVNVRSCPACCETRCPDPAECLHFLTANPWGDCDSCAGRGWAGEESRAVYCEDCGGSGLMEYTAASIGSDGASGRAKVRHAAHVERLTSLVSNLAGGVAA
ncbi:hypothetical protein ACF08M_01085 [Streptomyces sp. NPDC015032]|uniref:hypothetical protein n=1 Tax=Streptomyces sp. NPDC015032 TaxID=3364937 RepID=UPI0036F99D1A